ncbi:MAG TPA: TSUP family transporter, partial [Afifellaceae bacterium]|nr:TSUP family transporter [Afifellaceae bacterium]
MAGIVGALPPLWILAVASVVIVCGAVIQSSIGMGFGLTVAPVLAVLNQDLVPGPILVMGFLTAGAGALREWRHVDAGEVGTALAGRLAGGVVATWVITILPDRSTFSLLFGLTILAMLALAVAGWRMAFTMTNLAAMGWVSGLTGTITGVGAPPLAMVYQDRAALAA